MSKNHAFKDFLHGLSCWLATTGADAKTGGGLESKTVLKIQRKSFTKYYATEDKGKTTGKETAEAEVEANGKAEVWLPLMRATLAKLF